MRLSLDEFGNNGYTFKTPKMAHKEFNISSLQIRPFDNLLKYLKVSQYFIKKCFLDKAVQRCMVKINNRNECRILF